MKLNDNDNDPQGSLTVTGRVGEHNASIIINKTKKSESYALIIPILDLAIYPEQDISIEAETKKNGLILISPPKIIVDHPVYIGCYLSVLILSQSLDKLLLILTV